MEITLENIDYDKEQNSFLVTLEINGRDKKFQIDEYSSELDPDCFGDITENQYEALEGLADGLATFAEAMGREVED